LILKRERHSFIALKGVVILEGVQREERDWQEEEMPYDFYTDNGPDYSCPKCGADTTGEIGHECKSDPGGEDGVWAESWRRRIGEEEKDESKYFTGIN